jgi:hypothetical protein
MAILTALLILIAPVRIILKYDKSMNNEKVIRQGIVSNSNFGFAVNLVVYL